MGNRFGKLKNKKKEEAVTVTTTLVGINPMFQPAVDPMFRFPYSIPITVEGVGTAAPSAPPMSQAEFIRIRPTLPQKEPMLLLDTTGSMNKGTSVTDETPRCETIREAISLLVSKLAAEDSQAEHEEDGGGLRTITFADNKAHDMEDLNPQNLREKWNNIEWSGGTYIMPGWNLLQSVYYKEFGKLPEKERPLLLALVITDGEAMDIDAFSAALERDSKSYVVIAILGYGAEHDDALRSFNNVAQRNYRVKVITLQAETDPESIARTLLRMIE